MWGALTNQRRNLKDVFCKERWGLVMEVTAAFGRHLIRQKWKLALIISLLIGKIILTLTTPMVLIKGIDMIIDGLIKPIWAAELVFYFNPLIFGAIFLKLAGKFILGYLLAATQKYIIGMAVGAVVLSMKQEIKDKLAMIPFRRENRGEKEKIQSSLLTDFDVVGTGLEKGFMGLLSGIITLTVAIYLMIQLHFGITLIAVASTLLALAMIWSLNMRTAKKYPAKYRRRLAMKYVKYLIILEIGVLSFVGGSTLSVGQLSALVQYENTVAKQLTKTSPLSSSLDAFYSAMHCYELLHEAELHEAEHVERAALRRKKVQLKKSVRTM